MSAAGYMEKEHLYSAPLTLGLSHMLPHLATLCASIFDVFSKEAFLQIEPGEVWAVPNHHIFSVG